MRHDSGEGQNRRSIRKEMLRKRLPEGEIGVYLVGKKFFRIEQQPWRDPTFVSNRRNVVTSFSLPKNYGNLGYLAHNSLAGAFFFDLDIGDEVMVLPEFGNSLHYRITQIMKYRALQPRNPRSRFINIQTDQQCSAGDVFRQVYTGAEHMVLQTCIAKDDVPEWGRIFIIAEPIP